MRVLLWLVFIAILLPSDLEARRVALVIGNGDYAHATPLPNPTNDAAAMVEVLSRLDFEVVEGRDLDRADMQATLGEFANRLAGAETGLLFYAGHGIQVGGVNYLVPIDAALTREADVFLSLVSLNDVLQIMETEVPTRLVLLDACRDNPLARSLQGSMGATRSASVGQGLARVDTAAGTLIAYATAPGDVAEDGQGRNSPFTEALLNHIETPGLEARQILTRVRSDVLAETQGRQLPWDSSSLTGDFYFNDAPASVTQDEVVASAAPSATDDYAPGSVIQDCPRCPEMVVIPAGDIEIGANPGDPGYEGDEYPRMPASVEQPFAIMRFEVTRALFGAFVDATGHVPQQGCYDWKIVNFLNRDYNWRKNLRTSFDDHPVVCVSKLDAQAFADYMSAQTDRTYRLPSEAEFMLAASGGQQGFYAWPGGIDAACTFANVYDASGQSALPLVPWAPLPCDDGAGGAAPVGSFEPNGYGLFDMIGNAMEYVDDCWFGNLDGHPGNGRAWTQGGDCTQSVVKGGSFWPPETGYQLPDRWNVPTKDGGFDSQGFRLVRELP